MQQTFQTNRLILCIQKVSLKTLALGAVRGKRRLRIRPSLALANGSYSSVLSLLGTQPAHI
jgi:hypothetical protein